jgi:hypothetical protein
MNKFKTDGAFRAWAIKQVQDEINREHYPCKISRISEVSQGSCEWCSNTTRVVYISLIKTGSRDFTRGHPNNGQYSIHEDPSFRAQCEWFVCGKCSHS